MKVVKSHAFWIGIFVALLLVGFIPQLNVVATLKGKGKGSM